MFTVHVLLTIGDAETSNRDWKMGGANPAAPQTHRGGRRVGVTLTKRKSSHSTSVEHVEAETKYNLLMFTVLHLYIVNEQLLKYINSC